MGYNIELATVIHPGSTEICLGSQVVIEHHSVDK